MKLFTIALLALSINVNAQVLSLYNSEASAKPDNTCAGQSVQLSAVVSGETENYTYSWSSIPSGFNSTEPDPVAAPQVTTLYSVEVNDGLNTEIQSVTVTVKPLPIINLIPNDATEIQIISPNEISLCPFKSVILDAGNPGYEYLWNDGSTLQTMLVQTSGISYDFKQYEVLVTDPATGCSNSSTLSVNFEFEFCSYGMEEQNSLNELNIYPNPSTDGIFYCRSGLPNEHLTLEIYTTTGILVKSIVLSPLQSMHSNKAIDLKDQPSGLYLVKVTGNEASELKKILIQR